MNILIKLTCLIGLVIAPILGGHSFEAEQTQDVNVEVIYNSEDSAKAFITYSKVVSSDSVVVVEKTFKGTEQEVEDAVDAFLNENRTK